MNNEEVRNICIYVRASTDEYVTDSEDLNDFDEYIIPIDDEDIPF